LALYSDPPCTPVFLPGVPRNLLVVPHQKSEVGGFLFRLGGVSPPPQFYVRVASLQKARFAWKFFFLFFVLLTSESSFCCPSKRSFSAPGCSLGRFFNIFCLRLDYFFFARGAPDCLNARDTFPLSLCLESELLVLPFEGPLFLVNVFFYGPRWKSPPGDLCAFSSSLSYFQEFFLVLILVVPSRAPPLELCLSCPPSYVVRLPPERVSPPLFLPGSIGPTSFFYPSSPLVGRARGLLSREAAPTFGSFSFFFFLRFPRPLAPFAQRLRLRRFPPQVQSCTDTPLIWFSLIPRPKSAFFYKHRAFSLLRRDYFVFLPSRFEKKFILD